MLSSKVISVISSFAVSKILTAYMKLNIGGLSEHHQDAALPRWVAAKPNVSTQLRGGGTSQPGTGGETFFQGEPKARVTAV